MKGRRQDGLALVTVTGVLILLSAIAVAISSAAYRLRVSGSVAAGKVESRLLSLSGIGYAGARLFRDDSRPASVSKETQADDWKYRDDRSTDLSRSTSPSYAQTEPYHDLHGDNGRYDPVLDPYVDLNGNNRFDAWSGRLRGRHGPGSATFNLKISGENTEGGLNVNSGLLDDTDLNQNGVPDYRDLGAPAQVSSQDAGRQLQEAFRQAGISAPPPLLPTSTGASAGAVWYPREELARNRRVAHTLNQLGSLLGATAFKPGDSIILNRPQGGYRHVDEMARLFLPPDWTLLRPHLSTTGRWNRNVAYYLSPFSSAQFFHAGQPTFGFREGPDRQYLLNSGEAALEAIAALFSERQGFTTVLSASDSSYRVSREEALRTANFLKAQEPQSWVALFRRLNENRSALFTTGPGGQYKAGMIHALAMPEEVGGVSEHVVSTFSYDDPLPSIETSFLRLKRDDVSDQQVSFVGGSAQLGMSSISSFSIASAGLTRGVGGRTSASRSSGAFQKQGWIEARSQVDFENFLFTPAREDSPERITTRHRFGGGAVIERPAINRTATYPCFSRDACLDLARDPLASQEPAWIRDPSIWQGTLLEQISWLYLYDFNYCPFYGFIGLLDRSWIDPEATFYQPRWDFHHPDREQPVGPVTAWKENFDDTARQAKWVEEISTTTSYIRTGTDFKSVLLHQSRYASSSPWRVAEEPVSFRWNPGGGNQVNSSSMPLVDPNGNVEKGAIGFWHSSVSSIEIINYGRPTGGGNIQIQVPNYAWAQYSHSGNQVHGWSGPGRSHAGWTHLMFTFDASGMSAYIDGIPRGGTGFEVYPADPTRIQFCMFKSDEFRLYQHRLPAAVVFAHALRGRFWSADPSHEPRFVRGYDLHAVPSFTSPLYQFDSPVELTDVGWDGFVPDVLRDAADAWNAEHQGEPPKVPMRVELLVSVAGAPVAVPLDPESWRTGGYRTDFKALWKELRPADARPPKVESLRYRVWLDISDLEPAEPTTPFFDAVEIGFKAARIAQVREE